MKIIILGVGKVGESLVENFTREGHDITILDKKEDIVSRIVNRYDVNGIVGSGIEHVNLINSGVNGADLFIACTSRDEINVLTCVLAKKLGASKTIARVRDRELFKEMGSMKEILGIDLVFNPEYRTAIEISEILKFPFARNVENFANGGAYMVEFSVGENSPIIGKSLIEIATYGNKVLFAMVERGNEVIIPRGDFIVNKDDVLHVVATEEELASFCKKIKIFKSRSRSAFVVGGGRISYYLASQLSSSGTSVKIMEIDKEKCKELSSVLTSVDVICADATEQAILDEENLKNYDACVLLTGLDETNVILSLYAIQQGVCKVIAKVGRDNVIGMVEKLGLDSVVSPKSVIANHIMRFVRMQQAEKGETINNLYRLKDKAEAMEFTVADSFKYQSTKLRELKVAPYAIIGGVVRDREFILPTGDTELFAGDRVIVVTTKQIKEFAEIFR